MATKNRKDRMALLDRLEKKYSHKLTKLYWQRDLLGEAVPVRRGMQIYKNQYLDYELLQ